MEKSIGKSIENRQNIDYTTYVKKIVLCYFSGTGMTKYIADAFVNAFGAHGIAADCFPIESTPAKDIDLSMYDMLMIAYPVHSFNAPQIVVNFVKQLPKQKLMRTAIVGTVGEDIPVNHAASDLLMKKFHRKGYTVFFHKLFEMPSNFIVKYDEAKVRRIVRKAADDVPRAAQDIVACTAFDMKKSRVAKILSVMGRMEWHGARIAGKFFYAKRGCSRCGECAAHCPNQNIAIKQNIATNRKSVHFKWRCGLCMRCVYRCPHDMIDIRQPLKFLRFDKWYNPELFLKHTE